VRLLTLIEIMVRKNLATHDEELSGLYEGNPKRKTATPTAKRLLKAFRQVSRVKMPQENQSISYLTPLSLLQKRILSLLELSEADEILFQNSG
jgi:hypothetical protein